MKRMRWLLAAMIGLMGLVGVQAVTACGGLFCQNTPVDQQAERIIFTVNKNDTITAYVQINYTGEAPDFSWVVPVPSVPKVDVAEIASFNELSNLTAPIFMPPLMPSCAAIPMPAMAMSDSAGSGDGVQVLASGTAGPYAYDVVTSPEPMELITWLRKNKYRITEEMEPLIKVYTDEGLIFLAMKLQPNEGTQDIQPVVMTYKGVHPMIPLRLTAVAANPNMNVITWILADKQAVPTNYAHPTIDNQNIRYNFGSSDGTNYIQVVDQTVDLYHGRAFITEYAGASEKLAASANDKLVKQLLADYPYITRVFGRISPEEMTVDPTFDLKDAPDVSNIHDLSKMDDKTFWACPDTDQTIKVEYDPNVVPQGFK
ncbi:MAG: DUF2330 domain-containing protein [Anaerolineaceae bacterium]|nr:DUF2330 domain-containing protein [Anaerolineaceae bacterium]